MVRSLILLCCALAGVLGGAALIGLPALGGAVIFDSLVVGVIGALFHDWPDRGSQPGRPSAPVFLEEYLQRKAAENW